MGVRIRWNRPCETIPCDLDKMCNEALATKIREGHQWFVIVWNGSDAEACRILAG